jgi:Na+/proline symporter
MDTINKYLRYFGFIFVIIFLLLGGLLIFSDYFNYIPKNFRLILASIIILYSAFRMVALVYKLKQKTDDEE